MANNRRRHPNAVPLASIATWVVVCLFVAGAGLGYVYLKNEIHRSGSKIKVLEKELMELTTQDEVVRSKIALLSSRAALQRRLNENFVKLVPITDHRLVHIPDPGRTTATELRAVSNQRESE